MSNFFKRFLQEKVVIYVPACPKIRTGPIITSTGIGLGSHRIINVNHDKKKGKINFHRIDFMNVKI